MEISKRDKDALEFQEFMSCLHVFVNLLVIASMTPKSYIRCGERLSCEHYFESPPKLRMI